MSRIVKSIVDSLFGSANADLHMVCRCAACTNSGKMDERHAVCGSRNAAFVAMMKSTYLRHRSDSTLVRRLDRTDCRPVHFQRKVRARLIVILNIRGENASQMFSDPILALHRPSTRELKTQVSSSGHVGNFPRTGAGLVAPRCQNLTRARFRTKSRAADAMVITRISPPTRPRESLSGRLLRSVPPKHPRSVTTM